MPHRLSAILARAASAMRSWGYDAVVGRRDKRDLRIDLLRGFCVFVMIVDHVGGDTSWLYVLTGGNHFFVSAAEGFVLLSGVTMGLVHRGVIARSGIRGMLEKVFGRAWFLYALTVILTITFAAASGALGTPWAANATPARSGEDFAFTVLTLQRSYSLTDVLLLYTLLVLAAGPALWLIARGYTRLVVVTSVAVWALGQIWPGGAPWWEILDGGFPFACWQVLFFLGLAIGYHREQLARWLVPSRLLALGTAVVVALTCVDLLAQYYFGHRAGVDVHAMLFDKNDARIGRVLAVLAAGCLGYALTTLAWRPLRRATGGLLLLFGQQSLFAYGAQLFVVAFWSSELTAPLRAGRENALFQAAAVAMVWAACRVRPAVLAWARSVPLGGVLALPRRAATGAALILPLVFVASAASATTLGNELLPTGAPVALSAGSDQGGSVAAVSEAIPAHRPPALQRPICFDPASSSATVLGGWVDGSAGSRVPCSRSHS